MSSDVEMEPLHGIRNYKKRLGCQNGVLTYLIIAVTMLVIIQIVEISMTVYAFQQATTTIQDWQAKLEPLFANSEQLYESAEQLEEVAQELLTMWPLISSTFIDLNAFMDRTDRFTAWTEACIENTGFCPNAP